MSNDKRMKKDLDGYALLSPFGSMQCTCEQKLLWVWEDISVGEL